MASFVRFPAPYEDSIAPSAPTNLSATGGVGTATLSWTAATDNVGVTSYDVYRSTIAGFTPSAANQVGQTASTSFTDTGVPAGSWFYKVTAEDAAGNVGEPSASATATVVGDTKRRPCRPASTPLREHLGRTRLDRLHRQRRRHRLPDQARRNRNRDAPDHGLQRHRPGVGDHLQLHGQRTGRRRQRERQSQPPIATTGSAPSLTLDTAVTTRQSAARDQNLGTGADHRPAGTSCCSRSSAPTGRTPPAPIVQRRHGRRPHLDPAAHAPTPRPARLRSGRPSPRPNSRIR